MKHTIEAVTLFDAAESQRRKEIGCELAAAARKQKLQVAQEIANELAKQHGSVHMDMVAAEMLSRGCDPNELGNAAGTIFKGKQWMWTGEFVASHRVSRHSGLLRVWRKTTQQD
jgi:hypothetical protein